QEQGILTCPVCDTTSVIQKLHPIAIKKASSNTTNKRLQASQEAMTELTERVAEYVEKNFEDVGTDFTKQALKMHYGAEDYQNIRGSTTKEDDKILAKEGVPVLKVPIIKKQKDDLN
ncbi:DUF1178 family protein, partial [bacterium]|nr:DUF1178 family protein [bacterium]